MSVRTAITTTAAILALGTAGAADAKAAPSDAGLPLLTSAFATAYTVNAIDQRADVFPSNLAVSCKRASRVRFVCSARWVEIGDVPADRLAVSGKMIIWLQRHSAGGPAFWHYSGSFPQRNRVGRVVGRYAWK